MSKPILRHRCGGTLIPTHVLIVTAANSTALREVEGYRCAECGEQLVGRVEAIKALDHVA